MIEYYNLEEEKLDACPLTGDFYRHIVAEHDEQWCKFNLFVRKKDIVGTRQILFENPFVQKRITVLKTVEVYIDCGDRFRAINDK